MIKTISHFSRKTRLNELHMRSTIRPITATKQIAHKRKRNKNTNEQSLEIKNRQTMAKNTYKSKTND